jgi:hypothetical protein
MIQTLTSLPLLLSLVLAAFAVAVYAFAIKPHKKTRREKGTFIGVLRTCDAAFTFRMNTGFPGEVNRTHPASIEPCLIDVNSPPTAFGQPCVVDATTQGVRPLAAGDTALDSIYGFTVRPYPTQQQSGGMSSSFNSQTPPVSGIVDVLRSGYILTPLSNPTVQPVKGGRVYIWIAASSGAHVQNGVEAAATGGSTIELDEKSSFNGSAGPDGICEVSFNA